MSGSSSPAYTFLSSTSTGAPPHTTATIHPTRCGESQSLLRARGWNSLLEPARKCPILVRGTGNQIEACGALYTDHISDASSSTAPVLWSAGITIRVSPVILVRRWDAYDDIMHNIDAPPSYSTMREAIGDAFGLTVDQAEHFCLYYLTDPSIPLQSKKKITDQYTYEQFLARYDLRYSDNLILHIRDSSAPSGTPQKEPVFLRINTESANEIKQSLNHLPPASSSTDSQGRKMIDVIKQCIIRDGEDRSGEKIHCVFCHKMHIVTYEKGSELPEYNGEVVHIVSFAEEDREGMAVPDCLRFYANGLGGKDGVDVVQNVIYLCLDCQSYFDSGQVWGQILAPTSFASSSVASSSALSSAAATPYILLHVESLALQEDHGKFLAANCSKVNIPSDRHKRLMFPFDPPWDEIWRWNQLWAAKRRKSAASSVDDVSSLTQALNMLHVSPLCEKCKVANAVKSCKNAKVGQGILCAECCRKHGGCNVSSKHMITKDV